MKLWHDDVRPPPEEGWTWVRTNDDAKHWLAMGSLVSEISLDHDLGLHDVDVPDPGEDPDGFLDVVTLMGQGEDTGYNLVCWMVEHEHVPDRITIHSWNALGARRMANHLNDHGYDCVLSMYKVPS